MKKILVSATAFTLLTVGYNSAAFAEKNPNDKDCGNFSSKQEVMEFWHNNGYSATNDPHDLDRDNDGLPCEVKKGDYDKFLASKQTTNKDENKQEPAKQDSTTQNNQGTNNKQEQTKPQQQNAVKETKKSTDTVAKKQGEKLPNTASNSVTMMLASLGLALAGSILMFRRKKTNA